MLPCASAEVEVRQQQARAVPLLQAVYCCPTGLMLPSSCCGYSFGGFWIFFVMDREGGEAVGNEEEAGAGDVLGPVVSET